MSVLQATGDLGSGIAVANRDMRSCCDTDVVTEFT